MSEWTLRSPNFELKLQEFLAEQNIEHVVIRRGVYSGPRRASPLALKVETFLQEIPTLSTNLVHANTVTGWLQREAWLLPLPQARLRACERRVQARGIDTAAFVISKVLEHRASLIHGASAHWSHRPGMAVSSNLHGGAAA
jgi:hypothetical protein